MHTHDTVCRAIIFQKGLLLSQRLSVINFELIGACDHCEVETSCEGARLVIFLAQDGQSCLNLVYSLTALFNCISNLGHHKYNGADYCDYF